MAAVDRILSLLNYIEEVEKLRRKPSLTVPTEDFVAFQADVRGLPGLRFNLQTEDDDVWLSVPRLAENAPPAPAVELKPWTTLPQSPDRPPTLRPELIIEAANGRPEQRLRLQDHPEIQASFDAYRASQWEPWAAAELPRRGTIALYNRLFALQQVLAMEGAESPLELVWGIGYAVWKPEGGDGPVKHPLITQACELTLDEKSFDLNVRPRDVDSRIELDAYAALENSGVHGLEAFWRSYITAAASRINPFEDATFEPAVRAAVGHLDPQGTYVQMTTDVTAPVAGPTLRATNTWVLFARKRTGDIFMEDIRRLKEKLGTGTPLPEVITSLVEPGDDTVRVRIEQAFRGLSSSDTSPRAAELYFPMPYNDEQVSIVRKLQNNDGVVVQGPPGTGKTHTIANVICHYLAQGMSVLVTAKSDSALAVLQEKIPERVRVLSVSLLSDERDGMKQFEHSIQAIATSVAGINPTRAEATIRVYQNRLDQLHGRIATVDRDIAQFANQHMQRYDFRGKQVTPEELARFTVQEAESHQWFDDQPPLSDGLAVNDADINSLRQARLKVGVDLEYVDHTLPAVDDFPAWQELWSLHLDLVKARAIDTAVSGGTLLALANSQPDTFQKAQALDEFLAERGTLARTLEQGAEPWTQPLIAKLGDTPQSDTALAALTSLCQDLRELEEARKELLPRAVEVPEGAEHHPDFCQAVDRQVAGKPAFSLPFGKGEARRMIAAVTVQGAAPNGKEAWVDVHELLEWRRSGRRMLATWSALATEFGFDAAPAGDVEAAFRQVSLWRKLVEHAASLVYHFDARLPFQVEGVFGKTAVDALNAGDGHQALGAIRSSLKAHIDRGRLSYALQRLQEVVAKLNGTSGPVCDRIREFLGSTPGTPTVEGAAAQIAWDGLMDRLAGLASLRPSLNEVARVAELLTAAGAPKWAKRVKAEPATRDFDPVTPTTWADAWRWRQAVMFLDRIEGHHRLRRLFTDRHELTVALAKTYQDLVAEKTWLAVYNNSPDSVRQALQAYLNSIQAIGAGRGVRAIRHRRNARAAMGRAYQAVPCWILPQWRISETIPPEIGLFDLVIVDEASQSDIWALPALLRGKKLLVVGDHKQVSPSAVGTAEEKIKELSARFLADQPHGSEMTPDKSIYDLARVVFAGNSVMLKEHFRCVPAIIEFSNREFYEGDIRPLRVPKANERLDPPLIDVYVTSGHRDGRDVNPGEAKAIVDEIARILDDEQCAGRSIGVVTLQGTAQAKYIYDLITNRIPPEAVVARHIAVGPPPVFQGKERDIMMVSMVIGKDDRGAANRADMAQRFNVALSRARDRMYLFRSVPETDFREDSLNSRVIRHFKQPFRQDLQKVAVLRERCASGFEFEMFDELVKRGYRVEPQVPCGGYRIDFVVHGNEGRRLAIECDGDQFHGVGQWSDDMARQRVLERAGWTFWRCFASSFVRNRTQILQDLITTLNGLGIEPLGAEAVDSTVWTQTREVDPFAERQRQE